MPSSADRPGENDGSVEVGKCRRRRRIRQVVGGHVDALNRRNGPLVGGGDAFLKFPEVGGQRRLITDGGGHAAQEGRYFGARLRETEDVVDEQKDVLSFHIPEIFRRREGRQGHAGPGAGRFGHLAIDQGGLLDDPGVLHLEVEVVPLAGPLADAREDGDAAVVHGDVVDHLHHDDGLADAGAAEHPHLAAPRKGDEEVDDLDPGFEHMDRGVLFEEGGGLAVDGHVMLRLDGPQAVDRPPDHVEDPPEAFGAYRHADRSAHVLRLHPAHQTIGDVHGDAADDVVAQVLGDLDDQVVLDVVDRGVGDGDGVHDARELSLLERHVDDRTDDLYKPSNVHTRLLKMVEAAAGFRPPAPFLYPFASASVPPTMSISSAVIADCLTLLYLRVRL